VITMAKEMFMIQNSIFNAIKMLVSNSKQNEVWNIDKRILSTNLHWTMFFLFYIYHVGIYLWTCVLYVFFVLKISHAPGLTPPNVTANTNLTWGGGDLIKVSGKVLQHNNSYITNPFKNLNIGQFLRCIYNYSLCKHCS
jgi:hypothetical protein